MKRQRWIHFLTAGTIALLGATVGFQRPSQAQTTFVCQFSPDQNLYTTYAQTPRGAVPVVRWYSEHFSAAGYTPERRCQEVSARFQNLHSQRLLDFVTAGYLNGQPVVCASQNGSCNSGNLLFTLKAGSDAAAVLQQLFDLRSNASSTPLYQSSRGSSAPTIDMNDYLENAAVETPENSTSEAAPTEAAPAETQPSGGSLW